jgi:diadenosine tetraphosphate (Ap4A) HIT family hydrolase
MLSEEETISLKQKIIEQIESNFPEEQKEGAIKQIEEMNSEQFESFLKKNNLIKEDGEEGHNEGGCVFCSISSGKIKSEKIGENEKAIAVLEINPISRGHTIIIPKTHGESPKEAFNLAEKISKTLKKKLKAKEIKISNSKLFGHDLINVLPVYEKEDFNSERKKASAEELEAVKVELEKPVAKKERKTKESKIEKIKEVLWLPKRIP